MQTSLKLTASAIPGSKVVSGGKDRDRRQTAQYIADMALEMRNLAKGQGMVSLQGLLEVAYYEAFTASTELKIPEGEQERLSQMSKASLG